MTQYKHLQLSYSTYTKRNRHFCGIVTMPTVYANQFQNRIDSISFLSVLGVMMYILDLAYILWHKPFHAQSSVLPVYLFIFRQALQCTGLATMYGSVSLINLGLATYIWTAGGSKSTRRKSPQTGDKTQATVLNIHNPCCPCQINFKTILKVHSSTQISSERFIARFLLGSCNENRFSYSWKLCFVLNSFSLVFPTTSVCKTSL